MRKLTATLCLFIVLLFTNLIYAEKNYLLIPQDNLIYEFVDYWHQMGLIKRMPPIKPYSYYKLAEYMKEIENNIEKNPNIFSSTDYYFFNKYRELLKDYFIDESEKTDKKDVEWKWYANQGSHSDRWHIWNFYFRKGSFWNNFAMDPTFSVEARYLSKSDDDPLYGGYGSFNLNLYGHFLNCITFDVEAGADVGFIDYFGGKEFSYPSRKTMRNETFSLYYHPETAISFDYLYEKLFSRFDLCPRLNYNMGVEFKYFNMRIGNFKNIWGHSEDSNLIFSRNSPKFDALVMNLDFNKYLTISQLYGLALDQAKSTSRVSGKLIFAHRADINNFFGGLSFSIYEAIAVGVRPVFSYFIPFMVYKVAEMYENDMDNGIVGIDLSWQFLKHFKLFAAFAVDDWHIDPSHFNPADNIHIYVFQFGFKAVNPFVKNMSIYLQYTHSDPFMYTHYDHTDAVYKNLSWTIEGRCIGNRLPPHSDNIYFYLKYFPVYFFGTMFTFEWTLHGKGSLEQNITELYNYLVKTDEGNVIEDEIPLGKPLVYGETMENVLDAGIKFFLFEIPYIHTNLEMSYHFVSILNIADSDGNPQGYRNEFHHYIDLSMRINM